MLGRVAITVLTAVAAMFLNCSPNVKTSAAPVAHDAEPETAAPHTPIKYVAVVETETDAQSGASAEMNPAEVRQITAALRREAVENLPRGTYNIMTSETVQSMGGAVLEECADENCVITLGSRIGADYIVRGTISKFGKKFTLSVEMYETDNGTLVASSEYVRADNTAELMDKAITASANMYRKFINPQGFVPKQEQAPPAAPPPPQYQAPAPTPPPPPAVAVQQPVYQTPPPQPQPVKTYKTVVIGGKTWMAENLNYQTASGSWCYENDNSNCDKYGRLYDWNTARTVCPAGFHLPSRQEWNDLVAAAGGESVAGKKLKARNGWSNNGNGTDDYGFSALPGGIRGSGGGFGAAGLKGSWWTATERNGNYNYAYNRHVHYNYDRVYESNDNFTYLGLGYSVRCLQD